jgi:hypothetical protein
MKLSKNQIAAAAAFALCLGIAKGYAADVRDLKVSVLQGEDGVNILKQKTAVKPIVEVRDENNMPVAGAGVVFVLPHKGTGAVFSDGSRQFNAVTGTDGRAIARDLKPLGKGHFQMEVHASFQGHTAVTSISQTNFANAATAIAAGKTPGASAAASSSSTASSASAAPAAASGAGAAAGGGAGMSGLAIGGIVGGVAAAGATAAVVATHHSSSSTSTDCSSIFNQTMSDLNSGLQICQSSSSTLSQCQSAAQQALNEAGQYCSCSGFNVNSVPADEQQLVTNLRILAPQVGLQLPASCGF